MGVGGVSAVVFEGDRVNGSGVVAKAIAEKAGR
jgi:hypothetical protein